MLMICPRWYYEARLHILQDLRLEILPLLLFLIPGPLRRGIRPVPSAAPPGQPGPRLPLIRRDRRLDPLGLGRFLPLRRRRLVVIPRATAARACVDGSRRLRRLRGAGRVCVRWPRGSLGFEILWTRTTGEIW